MNDPTRSPKHVSLAPDRTIPIENVATDVPSTLASPEQLPTATFIQSPADVVRVAQALASGDSGTTIAGYEILGEVGRGAMGVVFKARHAQMKRLVALKMARGERATRGDLIRFLAEAEAVAFVKHANVVQLYDYGESDGKPFMVLEFCSGGSLADRLQNEGAPWSPKDTARMVARIAAGVAAAHEAGIVHRDLKPGNVLLDADGEPKVADFGLAKRGASELTATQAVMGTPSYMSPEQAGGKTKFVGPQADVWALGVILYEMLAGTRPFTGTTTEEVLAGVLHAHPPTVRAIASSVPRDLDLICRKCLEKNPADRYPSAAELAADLERFGRGEPISARPNGALRQLYLWARRNRSVAALSATVIVLLVLGSITCGVLAYRTSEAAKAAEARALERDQAVQKQRQLVREFMQFLAQDQKLKKVDRDRLTEAFFAAHPELDRDEVIGTFAPAPDFGGLSQGAGVGQSIGLATPNLFGD